MNKIIVDHSYFERTADAIEKYIANQKNKMIDIDNIFSILSNSWQGKDYAQLEREWQQIKGPGSTADKLVKSLESYAQFLRFVASKYRSAQANAINRANKLPKY